MIQSLSTYIRSQFLTETWEDTLNQATCSKGSFSSILKIVYYALLVPAKALDKVLGNEESPLFGLVMRSIKSAVVLKSDRVVESATTFCKKNKKSILITTIAALGIRFLIWKSTQTPSENSLGKLMFGKEGVSTVGGICVLGTLIFLKNKADKNSPIRPKAKAGAKAEAKAGAKAEAKAGAGTGAKAGAGTGAGEDDNKVNKILEKFTTKQKTKDKLDVILDLLNVTILTEWHSIVSKRIASELNSMGEIVNQYLRNPLLSFLRKDLKSEDLTIQSIDKQIGAAKAKKGGFSRINPWNRAIRENLDLVIKILETVKLKVQSPVK